MGVLVFVIDFELGEPEVLDILSLVFYDIVEEEVEEHE